MCGFAGIFSYANNDHQITEDILDRMGDVIRHRGPDDGGQYISSCGRVGFSFRRLSIIDLSPAGHQPMSDPEKKVWLLFNGEIYNHAELRKQLEEKGYRYKSRTDTESIIYAYQEWGERFVERLDGMFAIALWDTIKERLFLYRDRIGIKPLYYSLQNGRFFFGSEIKAILEHPAVSAAVNPEALYHYLTYIHTPAPLTMFDGIHKLRAGTYLEVRPDGSTREQEYWDPATPTSIDIDFNDEDAVSGRIRDIFRSSVEKRMMSDVPFGVFLSGGIDSSANVAFMSELMDRPVDTFTIAIKGQEDTNEFKWARRISELYKTNHHEIVIDDSGFLELLPKIVYHQDEPLADPVCFPLYHVSKLARDTGNIVIQVGEGSDEQFAGYQSYHRAVKLMKLQRRLGRFPSLLGKGAYALMQPLLAARRVDYRQNIIRNVMEGIPAFWGNAIGFYETEKRKAFSEQFLGSVDAGSSYDLALERFQRLRRERPGATELDEIIYWEMKNRLAELLLMRVDKITMATSIEARVPFLDHRMIELSMNIPTEMKLRNGTPKYILKRALRGILPDEIIDRKKIGFAGSGKNMLTPEIFNHARSLLLSAKHDYFNRDYLRTLFDEFEARRINYTPQIWTLYNFELWHRWWIEGEQSF